MENIKQTPPKLLIAATVPETVRLLMRGQLNWFASHGYVVDVCTDPGSDDGLGNENFIDQVNQRHYIPMSRKFSIIQDLKSTIRWIRLIRRTRPDYLIACTPKASLLSLIAAKMMRVPHRVYILFGLRYETSKGISRFVLKLTERICGACSQVVLVVSPSLAKCAIEEKLISPSKIRTLGLGSSNGVDSNRFMPLLPDERQLARKKLGYTDEDFLVGFVGRLTPDKGIDSLVKAMHQVNNEFPKVKLLLIGPNEGSEVDEIWAQSVGSQPDTSRWHPLLDVLVLPTRREGFPNVVLEAHACEIPVVTTRATGAIDSVLDGENGILIDIDDASQLAEAITRLATNRELGKLMGKNGRQWVVDNFQPEAIWRGMDQIFRTM